MTEGQFHTTMLQAEPATTSSSSRSWWTLPSDVLSESVRRIRPSPGCTPWRTSWRGCSPRCSPRKVAPSSSACRTSGPPVFSILGGVVVALLVSHTKLSAGLKLRLGLAFEVLASFGIAAAEYHDVKSPMLVTKEMLPGDFGLPGSSVGDAVQRHGSHPSADCPRGGGTVGRHRAADVRRGCGTRHECPARADALLLHPGVPRTSSCC